MMPRRFFCYLLLQHSLLQVSDNFPINLLCNTCYCMSLHVTVLIDTSLKLHFNFFTQEHQQTQVTAKRTSGLPILLTSGGGTLLQRTESEGVRSKDRI